MNSNIHKYCIEFRHLIRINNFNFNLDFYLSNSDLLKNFYEKQNNVKEIINHCGIMLFFVKNKTLELCLIAVKQDGMALKFVENQTYEMCFYAISEYAPSLQFVHNQTKKLCMMAVKIDGNTLEHVKLKYQDNEMCLIAVKQNGLALEYVNFKTYDITRRETRG